MPCTAPPPGSPAAQRAAAEQLAAAIFRRPEAGPEAGASYSGLDPAEYRRLANERLSGLRCYGAQSLRRHAEAILQIAEAGHMDASVAEERAAEYRAIADDLPRFVGVIAARRGRHPWAFFLTGEGSARLHRTFPRAKERAAVVAALEATGLRVRDDDAGVSAA